MKELPWIAKARLYLGLAEDTSKATHAPFVLRMLEAMGQFTGEAKPWWRDDETPWCGLLVGYCLGFADRYVVRDWFRARAWESDKLTRLERPAYGCVVVFSRVGGGHVGFVVGQDAKGNLMVLGGNQSNRVSIVPFAMSRATGFYWPSHWKNGKAVKGVPQSERYTLPRLSSDGKLSTNEA